MRSNIDNNGEKCALIIKFFQNFIALIMTKISGFTYVRNGFKYGVPFIESIKSILSVCDEFIIVVGDSDDGTREAVKNILSDKIRIIDTIWDMSLRQGGKIFAEQTNIGLDAITGDWGFHIQADEVIHEKDLPLITEAIESYKNDPQIEGLLFPFLHFWGDYNHIQTSRRVHRHEIRVFRNNQLIRSYRDSQGFRIYNSMEGYTNATDSGKKLKVKLLETPVYHYNGVKDSMAMHQKSKSFSYFYGHDVSTSNTEFNYHTVPRVELFRGSHPSVMADKIATYNYVFNHDTPQAKWKVKDRLIQPIEDLFHIRFGEYKNYILLK